jgi:meso-butanediol dehydrogenase/(S,S)-butanediol dehydrogenase/diacetyl reductase
MDFNGKKVLVTGGARGIGEATVLAFREGGADVAVGARGQASFDAFVERNGGERCYPALGDVASRQGCFDVVSAAFEHLGGLDVLVNSAGVFSESPFEEITEAQWEETWRVNAGGVFFCSQAALPHLEKSGGSIVNVVSDAGLIGYPLASDYSAAKGGAANLTRALAVELAGRVRVNGVCPGNVDTDMIRASAEESGDAESYLEQARARAPMKRMARPEEVAAAICFLAGPEAGFITGALLPVDGGGTAGF